MLRNNESDQQDKFGLTKKRIAIATVVSCVVVVTATAWGLQGKGAKTENTKTENVHQAMSVEVAEVHTAKIIDWRQFSGRLEAVNRVDVRPQVSGVITAVHFKDGALVKKGDVLFTIDQRQFAAEVLAAEARAEYAALDFTRAERLLAENAIAKRDFEEKKSATRSAVAALRIAKLNLEFSQVRAPIDGRISRAEVTVGNLVNANASTPLTTIVSSDKIYASFDVDEQTFLKLVNPARAANSHKEGINLPVFLGLANEEGYSHQGSLNSVDNRFDTTSGTIRIRAVFDNKDDQLVPGLFARIRLGGNEEYDAVLITEKAIGTDQDKRFVLALDAQNKSEYREIRLGPLHDGLRVVESGLKNGDRIIVNGLQRVRPGDVVAPKLVNMDGTQAGDDTKPMPDPKSTDKAPL